MVLGEEMSLGTLPLEGYLVVETEMSYPARNAVSKQTVNLNRL